MGEGNLVVSTLGAAAGGVVSAVAKGLEVASGCAIGAFQVCLPDGSSATGFSASNWVLVCFAFVLLAIVRFLSHSNWALFILAVVILAIVGMIFVIVWKIIDKY